jgi:hypothetical protein
MAAVTRNDKRTIFGWAMYDWANSAYITIFGAVVGAFFTGTIMEGDEYWGMSGDALFSILVGIGSIILLLAMPVLGAVADYADAKKRFLRLWAFVGALFALVIPFVPDGQVPLFLLVVVISQFGFVAANVFYDAYLPEIASDDTIDRVSSKGFRPRVPRWRPLPAPRADPDLALRRRGRCTAERGARCPDRDLRVRGLVGRVHALLARQAPRRRAGSGQADDARVRRHRVRQDVGDGEAPRWLSEPD